MNDWAEVQKSGTSMTFHQFWEAYKSPDFDLNTMITPPSDHTPKGNTRTRSYKTTNKRSRKNTPAYLTGEEDPFDQTDEEFWGDDLPTTTTETPNPVIREKKKTIKTTIKGDLNNNTDEDGNLIDPDQIASPDELHPASLPKTTMTPTNDISVSSGDSDFSNGPNGLVVYPEAGQHKVVPEFDFQAELASTTHTSQMEALYHLLHGDNVILSGQAGAGKSWVIETFRKIVDDLINPNLEAENGSTLEVAYTASTGVAATIIRGRTIHSWSGLGIDVDPFSLESLPESKKWWMINNVFEQIRQTDCLIIDEVSMLPAYFLSNLDRACKIARKKLDKPFGGLQVVLVGDFLQLPPVDTHQKDSDGHDVDASYCFHAKDNTGKPIFGVSGFKWCYLDRVRRSKDDRLTDLLNGIRNENVSKQDLRNLRSRFGMKPEKGKSYTQLRTVNRSVDSYNEERLAKLHGNDQHYRVSWEGDAKKARELIKNAKMTDIDLKPGAVVMLTSNRAIQGDSQHVNGSMGTILECDPHYVRILFNDGQTRDVYRQADDITQIVVDEHVDEDTGETVVEELEETIATVKHLPIRLAWAITVHKSQGQTLDGAIIDLSKCFQKGLGYVALSRCKSLDDIIMEGSFEDLPVDALKIDDEALKADRKIRAKAKRDREALMENEVRVHDLEAALNVASSKAAVARLRKQIDEAPGVDSIMGDDKSCYEFVRDHRARKLSAKKRSKQVWDNAGRGGKSPSGFGFHKSW